MCAVHRPRGFTLLEVMVVLVLIGIITGLAVISVGGGPHDRMPEEAQRLAAWITVQQEEALLNGEQRGIRFEHTHYTVFRQSDAGWAPIDAGDVFTSHHLPGDMQLNLWVEGQTVSLKEPGPPQVVLLSSGEATEFAVVFSLTEEKAPDAIRHRVVGDALGRLTVSQVD